MKKLLLYFFIGLSTISYSQTCPTVNAGSNTIVNCNSPCTILNANYTQINQTNTYLVSNIPFAPQPATGTLVNLTDDSQAGPFPIGFTFCFFGNPYTQFWIGSNGWISFSAGQPNTFTSTPIPSGGFNVPKNCIMGPWQDWHPGLGGQIRYQTQGTAPCRRLVVTWTNVTMFSCTSLNGTFQIVIYETTNIIENHITNKPNCLAWAGGTAVEGIHNLAGTTALTVPGRNSTQWTTNNNSWRWTPNGALVPTTVNWYNGNSLPLVLVGTGQNYNACPIVPTNYVVEVNYTNCNGNIVVVSDTVFVDCQLIPPNTSAITHN